MKKTVTERIAAMRDYLRANGLAAYIVPSSDPHSSEYVAECWKAREWITGFDGSAGTAVVTLTAAALWTDSRYWLAAEDVLDGTGVALMKDGLADTPSIASWLKDNVAEGGVVGVDGRVCSVAEIEAWSEAFAADGISVKASDDAFDTIWDGRPSLPMSKAEMMPLEVAGVSASEKLALLRGELSAMGADAMAVTMLDEIAWLTNLRGEDVDYNPVLVSYMLVTSEDATLFVAPDKISAEVNEYLKVQGVAVRGYYEFFDAIAAYSGKLLLNPAKCCYAVLEAAKGCEVVRALSPVAAMKAVKNSTEIEGFKKAMLAEGRAMVKLLHWLSLAIKNETLTELSVDRKLTEFRSENENFRGLSFATISAYGDHAAIVHYEPTPESDKPLQECGFLLLDCGGQYNCGTTDITRTIPLGALTEEEKEDYTRVLRGHISLAMARFPKGTCGTQLDVLARQWLWRAGENYLHGTGHGVGHFLNVHEGPHQIRMNNMPAPLLPGVTVTNEPGLYKAGRFGIRIENTMLVVSSFVSEFGEYCEMEPLTICPISKEPIVPELLGDEAVAYLNEYHGWVYEKLSPFFDGEELEFLKDACSPL
ncbi:MAG: aminopeptidase P family protein [Bacteroidaceae bacterium]|nr:aminopeptidase P family protein [Bacteroidaceae bacterium]